MSNRTDSNAYTVIFAVIMVSIVGALLAGVSSALSGKISENKRIEKQQNILYAMGVNENTSENDVVFVSQNQATADFQKYIVKQLVIQNGKVTEDNNAYLIDLAQESKKSQAERKYPLLIGQKDGKTFYIIPMLGKGLWDAIWGYVAVDENLVIQGVFFDHKGETPGLGANIKERFFMDDFKGEHLLDNTGNFQPIEISKSNADPENQRKEDHKIDAIAGATITGNGLSAMLNQSVEPYVSYIKNLKN